MGTVLTFPRNGHNVAPAAAQSAAGFGDLTHHGEKAVSSYLLGLFRVCSFSMDGRMGEPQGSAGVVPVRQPVRSSTSFGDGVDGSQTELDTTMTNIPALTVGSIAVRMRDGLYSLNDLHRAAGSEKRHQPSDFLKIDQTKALLAEIGNSEDSRNLEIATGRNGGTYACRELVIAYAAWISPAFHLRVIRVFLESVAPAQAHSLTSAQKRQLQELVASKAKAAGNPGEAFPAIWGHLKTALQVPSYHEIPAAEFDHACELVRSFQLPAALPNPAAENFAQFRDAVQLAMEIMQASNGTGRVIYHAESKHIQRVQPDACVMNADGFIEAVSLGDLYLTDRQLHILSVAVGLAFAKRMEFLRQRAGLNMEQAA